MSDLTYSQPFPDPLAAAISCSEIGFLGFGTIPLSDWIGMRAGMIEIFSSFDTIKCKESPVFSRNLFRMAIGMVTCPFAVSTDAIICFLWFSSLSIKFTIKIGCERAPALGRRAWGGGLVAPVLLLAHAELEFPAFVRGCTYAPELQHPYFRQAGQEAHGHLTSAAIVGRGQGGSQGVGFVQLVFW